MGPTAGDRQAGRGASGAALVGRATEVADVAALLETVPLVTLVGPPGVGKSRIAGELLASWGTGAGGWTWLASPMRTAPGNL